MPDPNQNPEPEPKQEPPADGGTPKSVDFSEWLKTQSDEVKQAFEGHVEGLKGALATERDARKALEKAKTDAQKAEDDAAKQRLEEEGKFKELAEAAEKRATDAETQLAEMASLPDQVKRYKEALEGYVAKAREGVPDHVQTLLNRLDPVEQLDYLTENIDKFKPGDTNPGGPPNDPARGSHSDELTDDEKRKRSWRPRSL